GHLVHRLPEGGQVGVVAGAVGQGQVAGGALAGPAAGLVGAAGEVGGVGGRGAVQRHVQHLGVLPEHVLGAVAVVEVDVHDRHPAQGGQRPGRDGGGVRRAEPAGGAGAGGGAGRPAQGVGGRGPADDQVGGGEGGVGGRHRGREAP